MKDLSRSLASILAFCVTAPAFPAAAVPTLTVDSEQFQAPARALSPVQLWDTEWRLLIEAHPDGALLTRLEFRTRFLDDRPQTHAGGLDLQPSAVEPVAGRLVIELPARVDYERRFEARLRIHDAQGIASDWVTVKFPPERLLRPAAADAYVLSVDPVDSDYRIVGTVEFTAIESTRLSSVREGLERQAKAAGGDAAIGLRLERNTHDTYVFAADVIRYTAKPKPTPTPAAKATDRVLGKIVIPYEAR